MGGLRKREGCGGRRINAQTVETERTESSVSVVVTASILRPHEFVLNL